MTFKVGEHVKQISDGGFVWIPRTVVHGFVVESENAKFLFGFEPAGLEQMFVEISVQSGASSPAEGQTDRSGTLHALYGDFEPTGRIHSAAPIAR